MSESDEEFKKWHESEGFEEIRLGTNDMVNVSVLKDLWDYLYPKTIGSEGDPNKDFNRVKMAVQYFDKNIHTPQDMSLIFQALDNCQGVPEIVVYDNRRE